MKSMKYVFMFLFFTVISYESQAQLVSIHIGRPYPPPPRHCSRPACPGPDYIWQEGRWIWDDYIRDYAWEAGYWLYVQPRYVQQPYYRSEYRGRGYERGRGHEREHEHGRNRRRD